MTTPTKTSRLEVKGPVPVLVVLRSDVLVQKYAPYFPAPGAMFIGYQAPIAGRAFAAVNPHRWPKLPLLHLQRPDDHVPDRRQ